MFSGNKEKELIISINYSIIYNYKSIIKEVYDFRNSKEFINVANISPEKTCAYVQSYKPGNHLN